MSDYDASTDKGGDDLDLDEIDEAKEQFHLCEEAWQENRRSFLEDIRFGREEHQWPDHIRKERERNGRPCLTLNQLHAFIFQVVNDARQNKPGIIVHPVGSGADPEVADFFNGLIRHIEQSSDGDVAYDTAMDCAVSGGFGFWRVNTRYACDDNFDQELILERLSDAASVYPDPNSRAADSSDWNKCFILDSMPKSEFEKKYPDKDCVSFDGDAPRREGVQNDEEQIQIGEWWTREEALRTITTVSAIDPNQALAMPSAALAAIKLMPSSMIMAMDVYEANKEMFQALGVKPVGKTRDVKTWKVKQRICSGADVLETVEWKGTYIPIVPVWGEELNVEGRRIMRSLIRGAKDAQQMYNYWSTTSTELVALAPRNPWLGKVGAFETDNAKWATANTDNHPYIEYDGDEPPERQPFAGVPAGAIQQTADARQNIMSIVGIFNSSIGARSNEDSAVAINARDKQADTGSFHFTDNLSRAIRHCGRILIDLIPHVYSTPRILRILQPDGKPQMVPVNQVHQSPVLGLDGKPQPQIDPATGKPVMGPDGNPAIKTVEKMLDLTVGKYDLVVKAGPSFATQREQIVQMCTEIIRVFPAAAPVLADLIFRNYDMPGADEVADRLYAMMPQQAKGEDPRIQQGMQLIQELQGKIKELQGDQSYDQGELDVKRFDAETDRLKVIVGNQGTPADPNEMAQVVMTSLLHIMNSPDIFEGLASGQPPEQLAAMLAQKMAPQQAAAPAAPAQVAA